MKDILDWIAGFISLLWMVPLCIFLIPVALAVWAWDRMNTLEAEHKEYNEKLAKQKLRDLLRDIKNEQVD